MNLGIILKLIKIASGVKSVVDTTKTIKGFVEDMKTENIAVKHGESCVEYNNPQDVIDILINIPNNRAHYEKVAASGCKTVLTLHNPTRISSQLFKITEQ